jgi:hypothetical protein
MSVVVSFDEVAWLRDNSPGWRLLRADNAPLVLSFLHRVFVAGNIRSISVSELGSRAQRMRALRLAERWDKLLVTVRWIEKRQAPGMYLRQIDVPGVDTKFIERHKGILTELLDAQLDPARIDVTAPDFAGRYGFLRKPGYVRFRVDGDFRGFSELSVRAEEFAAAPEHVACVYVVENEITYLAFSVPAAAMVIFGAGYAVPVLEPLGWLSGCDVVYWGDIDTNGLAILNRLRRRFPHARSMLMDRATLLHRGLTPGTARWNLPHRCPFHRYRRSSPSRPLCGRTAWPPRADGPLLSSRG